jgi:hypothetical protein
MSIVSRTDIKRSDYLVQPTVIRLPNSSQLQAFFRDKRGNWIYYVDSKRHVQFFGIPKHQD